MSDEGQVALFDLDGSLCDFEKALRAGLKSLAAPDEPELPEDLWSMERYEYIRNRMRLIKSQPGFWLNLERMAPGIDVFYAAKHVGFDTQILTKGPASIPNAWMEKVQWCQRNLPAIDTDIHIVMNKGLVFGKVLYDDFPEYMMAWLEHRPRGLGIMPPRSCNKDFSHPNVIKYDGSNLQQVVEALHVAYERKSGQPLRLP